MPTDSTKSSICFHLSQSQPGQFDIFASSVQIWAQGLAWGLPSGATNSISDARLTNSVTLCYIVLV